jgi:hypothetical protein
MARSYMCASKDSSGGVALAGAKEPVGAGRARENEMEFKCDPSGRDRKKALTNKGPHHYKSQDYGPAQGFKGQPKWAVNSAGECHLHTVEVTGSNPVPPTMTFMGLRAIRLVNPFFLVKYGLWMPFRVIEKHPFNILDNDYESHYAHCRRLPQR